MFKVIFLLAQRVDMSPGDLTALWLKYPWKSVIGHEMVVKHVHNRTIPDVMPIENAPAGMFDAIDEFWFADAATAATYFGSQHFRDFWGANCAKLLSCPPLVISGTPHLLWQRAASQASVQVKIITLPARKDGMSPEEFAHYWIHIHSALALDGQGTKDRLIRLEPCPSECRIATGFPAAPFDGAGTIEFADTQALQMEFASDHYHQALAPDEPRFTDPALSRAVMVEPFLV